MDLQAKLLEYDEKYEIIPQHLMDEVVEVIEALTYPKTIEDVYSIYNSIEWVDYEEFLEHPDLYIYIAHLTSDELLVINSERFIYE